MSTNILGIGEFGASRTPGDVVKTLGLGSCVAVVLLDPATRTVGMVHVALPDSSIATPDDIKRLPGRFADTAIPALLNCMARHGAVKCESMIVKLAGGAVIMDPKNTFNIGKRNVLAIKKLLWERGMGARSEDVGANYSRSVSVSVDSGLVELYSPGRGQWTI
ncbi:MAG: chemotaxis protein CheD [Kiritimatiellae bacterium]|nr:chemotaxis protein CheD [Kiritimatiellia bacterium]